MEVVAAAPNAGMAGAAAAPNAGAAAGAPNAGMGAAAANAGVGAAAAAPNAGVGFTAPNAGVGATAEAPKTDFCGVLKLKAGAVVLGAALNPKPACGVDAAVLLNWKAPPLPNCGCVPAPAAGVPNGRPLLC